MASFEKDLAQYESVLGTIPGEVLKVWMKKVSDFDERYTKLVEEPIKFRGKVPIGYSGKKGHATPIKAHILAIIIALSKVKFEKRFSLGEASDLLNQVGLVTSKMGLSRVLPKYADSLGIKELIPSKDSRIVQIDSLADAEKLVQTERKNFAKKAKQEGWSPEKVKEEINKNKNKGTPYSKVGNKIESKEEIDMDEFKGREVVYEPTAKQTLFHAASEKIVLYGGAAG